LVDAKPGQQWKVLKSPAGTNVTVTTPEGIVTGMTIPTGGYQFVLQTNTDSLNCRDTVSVSFGACLSCIKEQINIIALTRIVCKGDTFPTMKALIIGNGTVNWYKTAIGGTPIVTNTLTYKPAGVIMDSDTFYVQAKSTDPNCTIVLERVRVIINVQDCTKEIDLALKKSIDKKIVQVGDVVTYTIKVWNQSQTAATGVEVTDSLNYALSYISSTASRGSYNATTKKWTIGSIASNGDTVTLTIKVKVLMEGLWFNTAEVSKADQRDKDSTPSNMKDGEDDLDRACFTVPFKLCSNDGSKVQATVPTNYTNVKWSDGQTGNTALFGAAGTYTFTASNGSCPSGGCCPIIIETITCCPATICVPFTAKRIRN
jgi:uncharacterized repeat protein (TIGR01451 family)